VSPRTAKIISRALIVVAMSALGASLAIASSVYPQQREGQIVVIGTPSEGDAPAVLADLQDRGAHGDTFVQDASVLFLVIFAGVSLAWLVTGSMIVSRQPKNASGWIFSAIGLVVALNLLPQVLVVKGAKVDPGSVPFLGVWASLGEYAFFAVALIPLLFLLYPDGRPPTARWRIAEYVLFAGLGVATIGSILAPGPLNNYVSLGVVYMNPLGVASLSKVAPLVVAVGTLMVLGASLSTVFAVRGRYKRSTGDDRQQLRWLVVVASLAGVLFVVGFIGGLLSSFIASNQAVGEIGFISFVLTLAVGVPIAYLIAIYRYRLYDLDIVVKKAVVFALMVGVVVALYLLIAVAVPLVLVGAGGGLQASAVFFGVVIGLLVFPVRTRARRFADRIIYGKRATPYEVLTSFSGRVGETYATDDVLPRMAQILAEGVGADLARVWLRVGGTLRPDATWPADAAPAEPVAMAAGELPDIPAEDTVPVRHQGEVLGALSVSMPASDPMTPAKERLVQDLAEQAGLVLKNVRLIEDLRASRQRLVAAQDQERRKLERNIHDGAQQQLVAQAVKLRLTEGMLERDPARAREMLAQLQADSHQTLEDLRDLARGIYPPLLADKGLAAALDAQARRAAIPVAVHSDGLGRFSQDVEAAVYFSCLEALQNIAKYAEASGARIELTGGDGSVRFLVTDDGRGFDPGATGYGTGLQGIADRLAALGGELDVTSAPGSGTSLRGIVPSGVRATAEGATP
jgi:signal transduction histidine kinase